MKNYPPDKYEYLSENEALNQWIEKQTEKDPFFQIRKDFLWECDLHLIVNRDFAFNTIWNGERIFLKKSFDLFLETGNGFFDITKPE